MARRLGIDMKLLHFQSENVNFALLAGAVPIESSEMFAGTGKPSSLSVDVAIAEATLDSVLAWWANMVAKYGGQIR